MRRLKFIYLIFFLALFIFGGFFTGNLKENKQNLVLKPTPTISTVLGINDELVKVVKVVDGDTIKVLISGKEELVRLIGIDTPEVADPRKPVQCFGKEASNKAKEILNNKQIRLEADETQRNQDTYGRLLRYVFLEDGTSFNRFMIEEGYAHEYTYDSNYYKYQLEFIQAQKEARENNKGLWASC